MPVVDEEKGPENVPVVDEEKEPMTTTQRTAQRRRLSDERTAQRTALRFEEMANKKLQEEKDKEMRLQFEKSYFEAISQRVRSVPGWWPDNVGSRIRELYPGSTLRANATLADVRKAFKKASIRCHPDKFSRESLEKQGEAEAIYKILGLQRKLYEEYQVLWASLTWHQKFRIKLYRVYVAAVPIITWVVMLLLLFFVCIYLYMFLYNRQFRTYLQANLQSVAELLRDIYDYNFN